MRVVQSTKRRVSKRLFAGLMALLVVFSAVTVAFINNEDALACGGYPNDGKGYFNCLSINKSSLEVLVGGLPAGISNKGQFIAHIEGLVRAGNYTSATNSSYNKIGAAYIIQTMRGGTDHNYPDNSDIADWKARINNPAISVGWSYQVANINSARSTFKNGVRDIYSYTGDGGTYRSFTFYYQGNVRYIVKQACGNPMGGLSLPDPVNYNLDPTMGVAPQSSEGGGTATVDPSVNNSGSTTSTNVDWAITKFSVGPNGTVPGGNASSNQDPKVYFGGDAEDAQPRGKSTFIEGISKGTIVAQPQTIGDYAVGTRLCFALSVKPHNQSTTNWRHSPPACITISKKPKIQVLGGDVVVGKTQTSTIVTSTTKKNIDGESRIFGSWGEYAVMSSGLSATSTTSIMASGAGYSGGPVTPGSTFDFCPFSLLTVSNISANQTTCGISTRMGGYSNMRTLPNVGARLVATSNLTGTSVNLSNMSTGSYGTTQNITVTSSQPIAKGKWVVINAPSATVTINSNINYTSDSLNSLSEIPQVVIIANQIRIRGSVTNIDAWLIASGSAGNIITCSDVGAFSELTATKCDNRLTVNGPVAAKHLYLYRTAGSRTGDDSGEPAEVFNLRPDAYLWATGYSADAGRLQTVRTKELPPLF